MALHLNTGHNELSLIINSDNPIKSDEYICSLVIPNLINKTQIKR